MCALGAVHIRRAREYSRQQYMQGCGVALRSVYDLALTTVETRDAIIAMMSDLLIGSASETSVTLTADRLGVRSRVNETPRQLHDGHARSDERLVRPGGRKPRTGRGPINAAS